DPTQLDRAHDVPPLDWTAGDGPSTAVRGGLIVAAGLGRRGPGMAEALGRSDHAVRVFTRVTSALRELDRLKPDTVVVGFGEGRDAATALLASARRHRSPAVLALIDTVTSQCVDRALAAGAHDVVPPPHSAQAVLLRRQVLLRASEGRLESGAAVLQRRVVLGSLTVDLSTRQVLDGTDPLTLSGREFELLVRLMEARGDVVSRAKLLSDIWGTEQGSEAVLDATVHRLRRKLDELHDEELIVTVRGVGYRLGTESFEVEPLPA
ncbi:MAG: response regulator transcription factor, partial [Longimicrobiales bacterium]